MKIEIRIHGYQNEGASKKDLSKLVENVVETTKQIVDVTEVERTKAYGSTRKENE